MENDGITWIVNSTVLIAIFVGASVLLLMYILKLFKNDTKNVISPKSKRFVYL